MLKNNPQYIEQVFQLLKKQYPHSKIVLNFSNHWELLVAVILSAQCTDKKVNEVTEKLFKKYKHSLPSAEAERKTIENYANVDILELERDIHSTGFYRNKAKNLKAAAQLIIEKFKGKVPNTMEEMLTIPGVARKTANVVLGNAYNIVEGFAVDTHVFRLSHRLGFSESNNPEKVEQDLMKVIPKKDWFALTYMLVDHGRAICKAPLPKCDECILNKLCPSAFNFPNFAK